MMPAKYNSGLEGPYLMQTSHVCTLALAPGLDTTEAGSQRSHRCVRRTATSRTLEANTALMLLPSRIQS